MTRIIKRKTLFLLSMIFTGLVGLLGSYLKANYSRQNSLIAPMAKADVVGSCGWCGCPWTENQCTIYYSCFPAGALISTPTGKKEIQDLTAGDVVYGFDTETGVKGSHAVMATLKHGKNDPGAVYSPLLCITHEKGVLTLTENHWVFRKNGRVGDYANFDRAGMLIVGDRFTLENEDEVIITKIENGPEYDFVYNLEVEGVHTYFADGVRVHNSIGSPGGCCAGSGGSSRK